MIGQERTRANARATRNAAGAPSVAARFAAFPDKLLAVLMAVVLATSLVPSMAVAQAADGAAAPASAQVAGATDGTTPKADGTPAVERPAGEQPAADVAAEEGASASDTAAGQTPESPEPGNVEPAAGLAGEEAAPSLMTAAAEKAASAPAEAAAQGEEAAAAAIAVTCSVIGVDAQGSQQTWAAARPFTFEAGATAADASTALFAAAGLAVDAGEGAYGYYLNTITSPFDAKVTLGWDQATGKYWQLFVNGQAASLGASSTVLSAGDAVTWYYSAYGDTLPGRVSSTFEVVGLDSAGNDQVWSALKAYEMVEGATAADLTETVLANSGITYAIDRSWGWFLSSVTSPFDETLDLGYDQTTGKYWQLFVNGKASDFSALDVALESGMQITWYYSAYEQPLPDSDAVVVNPDAPRPSYESTWSGYVNGQTGAVVTNVPTPSASAQLDWAYQYASSRTGVSDPLLVNGDIYLAANGKLQRVSASTGEVLAETSLGGTFAYFCRPVYAQGVVVVPADDGSLAAFTADALTCVWKTAPLSVGDSKNAFQTLSSLTVANDCVYAGFTMVGAGGVGECGVLVCVSLQDGSVTWSNRSNSSETGSAEGYYWAGAAVAGSDLVIGDESGSVCLIDGSTGAVLSKVPVGAAVRSGVVAINEASRAASREFLVVTADGTLHKLARSGNQLSETAAVSFAQESTSTPAVANGKVFVCGYDSEGYGTLSVIDAATLSVDATVRGGRGNCQSAPLVSVTGSGTYAYFTCNDGKGSLYAYKLGESEASVIFEPGSSLAQYCTASVIADAEGNLYYTNDSGNLLKLSGKVGNKVLFDSCGGSYVSAVYVATGETMMKPADPVRDGYVFSGWFADEACVQAWDFDAPVAQAMTLYAKWTKNAGGNGTGGNAGAGSGSGDSDNAGGSNAGTVPAAAGTIPATTSPLVNATGTSVAAAQPTAASSAQAASMSASPYAVEARSLDADGAAAQGKVESQNDMKALAVGGIALGVAGLAIAAGYVARTRRGKGSVR